ncbi:MAG TPA: hypothetical protein VLZ28_02805 [Daejeonella sp.]|nr:hypothetical protein [Daejeonella sp.]
MNTTSVQGLEEETVNDGFPSISVYLDYSYLPVETFLKVNNIILQTHQYMVNLFELDKEDIYQWYHFEIKELKTGNSSIINFEFNFHFPNRMKRTAKLEKAIKRFALAAGLFALVIAGQEIYLNTLKIKNEKTKLEQTIPPKTIKDAKRLNLNIDKLKRPETIRYLASVKNKLADAVDEDNIISLEVNGNEMKQTKHHIHAGSFDL